MKHVLLMKSSSAGMEVVAVFAAESLEQAQQKADRYVAQVPPEDGVSYGTQPVPVL